MALVVMGHGDLDGNLSDTHSNSIPVQEIIDTLSPSDSNHQIPKVEIYKYYLLFSPNSTICDVEVFVQ